MAEMTRKLKTVIDADIEIITPLYISGGNIYQPADVVRDDKTFYVIDEKKLIRYFKDDPKTIAELENPKLILQNFFNDHQELYVDDFIKYEIEAKTARTSRYGAPLNDFARSKTDYAPYIPGSTIKGAFLSGILWGLNQQARGENAPWTSEIFEEALQRSVDKRYESSISNTEFINSILGRDSNLFIQKAFQVPDIKLKNEDVGVFAHALFHCDESDGSNFSWSSFRKEHTTDASLVSFSLIEAVKPGTIIPIKILVDEEMIKKARLGDLGQKILKDKQFDFSDLIGSLFELAYNSLYYEKEYFAKTGHDNLTAVSSDLHNLAVDIAENNENEIMMRFGWGINYHGVTGFLWKSDTAKKLRLPMLKYAKFPYPKSRRIIFDGQKELGTPGWVKLKINL